MRSFHVRRAIPRVLAGLVVLASSCGPPPFPPEALGPSPMDPPAASAPAAVSSPAAIAPSTPDHDDDRCRPSSAGRSFSVGPGQRYENIGDVPFESLTAGDTVRILWREQPYREKMMVSGQGTADNPIRVCGVPGPDGQLPVIDGQNATTRHQLDFPFDGHQVRGLVIVGHRHGEPWANTPSYIVLEGLEVRNAAPPYTFTDKAGNKVPYSGNAAGIFVERANHLTIRGCTVTANNNGIFAGTGGGEVGVTRNVLIEHNYVHDNGSLGDYYEHNVYDEVVNIVYQYNHFGSPRGGKNGVQGANIKERSAGVVIRYNWIEDGAHVMDIVDAQESKDITRPQPSFHATYVYGNIITRGTPSGSLIHYGGDSGVFDDYRKGTLFFYNNTVIIKNDGYHDYTNTAVFELSTNEEHLDSRNNVYFSDIEPDALHPIGVLGSRDQVSSGIATFAGDWLKKGWTAHDLTPGSKVDLKAQVQGFEKLTRGDLPGFRDLKGEDYALAGQGSAGPAGSAGTPVALQPAVPVELLPTMQYVKHQRGRPRGQPLTVGALDGARDSP
jgi:hypothetical protein